MIHGLNPSRVLVGAVPVLLLSLGSGTEAAAQDGQSWRAWAGCWEAVDAPGTPTLCVVPTADPAVAELVSVQNGAVVERERIDASGQRVARVREGCSGWEQAEWSPDGRRLYTQSEYDCEGGLRRTSSGISSLLPGGEWLNVQGVEVSSNTGVRAIRYRSTQAPALVRDELAAAMVGRELAFESARVAATAPIALADVEDASRRADAAVVEAWLIESGQSFDMNAARLVQAAQAGVPGSVIDVMVALSYPRVFAIDGTSRAAERLPTETARAPRPGYGVYNPWFGGYPYDFWMYPGFGLSPYGFGGLGYSRFGYGYRWYPQRPIVVIRDPAREERQGRLVNNRGYTRPNSGSATSSRGDSGTSSTATTSRSGGSSSSGTSGSASGSSGSTSSGSSGATRTAQPRQ